LVAEEDRLAILDDRKRLIAESCRSCGVENFQIFGTSIWDETLYKAWSEIVTNLIPNIGLLENHLQNFCRICDADEVVLFERATFLVISHAQITASPEDPTLTQRTEHFDAHRFEKISNIVKQFKLSCGKAQSSFQGMEVRNSRFCAFIDAFTAHTYIMVIVSNAQVHTAATVINIQNAKAHFETFIPRV
jgi:Ras-related GTP-binding protein A/B